MQVAVAGVKNVRAAQLVLPLHLGDELEHRPEAAARDRAVHAVVIGRDAPDCRERRLASGPEALSLRLALRHPRRGGARALQHRGHAVDLLGDLFRRAVGFAQQDRSCVEVVTGVHELFHRPRHRLVHHLQTGGNDAGGDDRGHGVAGLADVVERREDHAGGLRLGYELHRHLGRDGEHPLGAGHEREEIVAGRIERLGAELHRRALDREAAYPENVVHGEPVLQAVHAAGVLGDVAADRARDLRRGIRCVEQPVGRGGLADREIPHARLHARDPRDRVDGEDALHLREREQHPFPDGSAPPESPVPAPRAITSTFSSWHVLRTNCTSSSLAGSATTIGSCAISRKSVALVGPRVLLLVEHCVGRQARLQPADDLGLAKKVDALGADVHRTVLTPSPLRACPSARALSPFRSGPTPRRRSRRTR